MKTFVLMISKTFMKGHPRAGKPTHFREKIMNAFSHQCKDDRGLIYLAKLHTIRENYEYWARIAEEVNAGRGVLSLRQWTKSPYNYQRDGSKQEEFRTLRKVGVQKLEWTELGWFIEDYDSDVTNETLATNDGLSTDDFKSWFKKVVFKKEQKPMAIIHFTDFRYA